MTSRLHRIEITNFKAFREFKLNLEGRHLLVYGRNGAGKSSLYWALHAFLQSAGKATDEVTKYFDPAHPRNLLNIHEQLETSPKAGEIALTMRDVVTKTDTTYRIRQDTHGTQNEPKIIKGDLASDFITYRFFFGFSHFRGSDEFNLWPLFEKEILPFCVSTTGQNPLQVWEGIKTTEANPDGRRGLGGKYAYDRYTARVEEFASMLVPIVDAISTEAQRFYDAHFAADDPAKVTLKLGLTQPPAFDGTNAANAELKPPVLKFGIQVGTHSVERPQMFLNEAKLTQLALSVRFAASKVNLHESDLKLLVLDDLLVSLDMSNRMRVVELLLSDEFSEYQKIILTHDIGFFGEFRRRVGSNQSNWCFVRLEGNASKSIRPVGEKNEIEKAEDYLRGHNLDEAALCLRKACEETARRFIGHNEVLATKDFTGLADALRAAKTKILGGFPVALYETVLRNTPDGHRDLLIASDDVDLENNTALDSQTRGRLKTNRKRLRQMVSAEHVERLRQVKLIDDILECTQRVLNPAAHFGIHPLYEAEVEQALQLVRQLATTLPPT